MLLGRNLFVLHPWHRQQWGSRHRPTTPACPGSSSGLPPRTSSTSTLTGNMVLAILVPNWFRYRKRGTGQVTLVEDPPRRALADEPQLLFAEAKERRRKRWAIGGIVTAVVVLLLVLVAVGVTRSGAQGPSSGRPVPASPLGGLHAGVVTGRLMLDAGVAASGYHALPGTVRFVGQHGAGRVVNVANDGQFTVRLPAGTYRAIGSSPQFLIGRPTDMPCNGRSPVVVRARGTSTVIVVCEGM